MKTEELLFRDITYPLERRLSILLNLLTLDEKISLLSTSQSAIPRLEIGEYHVGGEAAHGVVDRSGGKTTVFPQPIGLSSTWNKKLLKKVGSVIGDEARIFYELNDKKTGLTLWAPTIDMERDPRWGRTEEAYGEDPVLTGKLATALIKGMQGEDDFYIKLVAAPKHFYGNNNEYGRGYISNSIDPRNRREYYLKAFEPAFKEGGALSMMTAYNGVNGIPCMQMKELKEVVRNEWGMDGFIVSDGGALSLNISEYQYYDTHEEALADALKKSIDCFVDRKELVEDSAYKALEKGLITEDDITNAIGKMLGVRFRLGHFDDDHSKDPYYQIDLNKMCSEYHGGIAQQATKESVVLLKNENNTLPLDEQQTEKIAIIGPMADVIYKDWYTGDSAYQITPLQGLQSRLQNANITFEKGNDKVALKSVSNDRYVTVSDDDFHLKVTSDQLGEKEIFELEEWGWNGYLLKNCYNNKYVAQQADNQWFDANSTDAFGWFVREKISFQLLGNGTYHLSTWRGEPLSTSNDEKLIASKQPEVFKKEVITSGIEKAVETAKKSDVAIVFVGNNPMLNGRETEDRPDITLPKRQQQLVEAVYQANPKTIVVIIGSYPFAINWINDNIPAIVYSAHGSQSLGEGVASILYGDESPSGRLSMTWYKDVHQLPSIFDYDVIKGNRTYMYMAEKPLYPFGHGLTYTHFDYSNLEIDQNELKEHERVEVKVTIENKGQMEASEVVQLYATVNDSFYQRPKKQLVDFEKVKVPPGEEKIVTLELLTEQLTVWDVNEEAFLLESSSCTLSVGSSSEDIRLTKEVLVVGKRVSNRTLESPIRAENYNDYRGVYISQGENETNCVTCRSKGWICFQSVELHHSQQYFQIRATTDGMPGMVSIHYDDVNEEKVVEVEIKPDFPNQWKDYKLYFSSEDAKRDIYVRVEGSVSITTIQII